MPRLWQNALLSGLLILFGILGIWTSFWLAERQRQIGVNQDIREKAHVLKERLSSRLSQEQIALDQFFRSRQSQSPEANDLQATVRVFQTGFPDLQALYRMKPDAIPKTIPPEILIHIRPALKAALTARRVSASPLFQIEPEWTAAAFAFPTVQGGRTVSLGVAILDIDLLMKKVLSPSSNLLKALRLTDGGKIAWSTRTLPRDPVMHEFTLPVADRVWQGRTYFKRVNRELPQEIFGVIMVLLLISLGLLSVWKGYYRKEELQRANALIQVRNQELAALNDIIMAASQSMDLATVLQVALEKVLNLVDAGLGAILLLDQESGELIHMAYSGLTTEEIALLGNVRLGEGVTGKAAAGKQTIIVAEVAADPQADSSRLLQQAQDIGIRSIASIPLIAKEHVLGVLNVADRRPRYFSKESFNLLNSIGRQIGVIVENTQLYAREHRIAETLQRSFFLPVPERYENFEFAYRYRNALSESDIGGDFCDVFSFPDGKLGIIIADVAGRGLGPAIQTGIVRYALRAYAFQNPHPGDVLTQLNRLLCSQMSSLPHQGNAGAKGAGLTESFVTLFFGVLDPATYLLRYANAGHQPPILYQEDRHTAILLKATGTVVGAFPEAHYAVLEYVMNPGDAVLLYTDGLVEARGEDMVMTAEALRQFFIRILSCSRSLRDIADTLYEAAVEMANPPVDDTSLLVMRAVP